MLIFSLSALLKRQSANVTTPDTLTTHTWDVWYLSLFLVASLLRIRPHRPRVRALGHICAPYVREDVRLPWTAVEQDTCQEKMILHMKLLVKESIITHNATGYLVIQLLKRHGR